MTPTTPPPEISRAEAALRALLGEDLTPEAFAPVGKMRPFSAGVFATLHRTLNEWVLGIPQEHMSDVRFATLAWLYIQAGPLEEVRRVTYGDAVLDVAKFNAAVLVWADRTDKDGEPLFTPAMLDAAMKLITETMSAKKALDFEVKPRPDEKPDTEEPPNS